MRTRRRYKHTQDLALLALNAHHLHAGKKKKECAEECEACTWLGECVSNVHSHSLCCWGDVKHFSCYQSSVTQSSVDSWWFGGQSDGAAGRAEAVVRGEEKRVNLC